MRRAENMFMHDIDNQKTQAANTIIEWHLLNATIEARSR